MKTLGLVLLGAVAIGAIYFWNPTICSALNQLPGLDKFDLCNLGHGGVINQQDTHDRLSMIHHQAAQHHHERMLSHPHTGIVSPHTLDSAKHSPTPAFHPTSNSIGPGVGAGVALGLGNAAASQASFAEMSHHRMSI